MAPDGVLDTGDGSGRVMKFVRLTVFKTWGGGPTAIDRIGGFGG
ncbi:MAG: hypothetical protein QNJ13_06065 [Paracoccaceae bacterium]|nr:hypothetical protein [Paracoccaceae bacterium]